MGDEDETGNSRESLLSQIREEIEALNMQDAEENDSEDEVEVQDEFEPYTSLIPSLEAIRARSLKVMQAACSPSVSIPLVIESLVLSEHKVTLSYRL